MKGEGPTWLMGLTTVLDEQRKSEQLVASYCKVRNHLEAYEWGLCRWDETMSQFIHHKTIWTKTSNSLAPPPLPNGHAVQVALPETKQDCCSGTLSHSWNASQLFKAGKILPHGNR